MKVEELQEVLRKHELWLNGKEDGEGANLREADLREANLQGANLQRVDLQGADLRWADLGKFGKLKTNRPILQINPIGSRQDNLIAFFTEKEIVIQTGCFKNTLSEFKKALRKKSKDDKNYHEYLTVIKLIKKHAELWK
jgi:hypothetical protein